MAAEPAAPTVLHVSTPRTWRGGEQQLAWLVDELARLGVPQVVACPHGSALARHGEARGWRLALLRRRASVDPLYALSLARTARGCGAGLVHLHDAHAHTGAVLAAALFGLRAPLVLHRRVDFPVRAGAFSRWKYGHPAVRRVVCVSRAVAEVLRPSLPDPSRLRVVHDGVDLGRFSAGPDGRLRRELGLPAGTPLVGNVAALADHKDYPTFIAAAARLTALGVEAHYVAIGDGELRADLEARTRGAGLAGRLHFLGFRSDVPRLLPELDLFLFTSKTEGLGSSVIDALACRVPVVATRAGGVPELLEHERTALLAPVGDAAALAGAVARILADGALRARLVEAGAARAAELSAARMAERTLALYREVLGG